MEKNFKTAKAADKRTNRIDHKLEPADQPEKNIIFVGRRSTPTGVNPGIPPKTVTDGATSFVMPDAAEQLAGFYHAEAARIIRAFPKLYKSFISKGA